MSITLRGARFPMVWGASGVSNFHGQHYWFHRYVRILGHNFEGSALVAKTSTLLPRKGNMPLTADGVTPRELLPKCIYVDRINELALNAVSLSGPGLEALINMGLWQKLTQPFQISVMSLAKTPEERKAELKECFLLGNSLARRCKTQIGIQLNLSCPNGGLDTSSLIEEALPILSMATDTLDRRIPLNVKLGPDAAPKSVAKIAEHERCDALVALNTLGFGKHPTWATETRPVNWKKFFGTDDPAKSPIARYFPGFPGGLSGAPLRPFLLEWLRKVRALGVTKHINAGGGLFTKQHLYEVKTAGADSVSIGSLSFLKPLRPTSFIRDAQEIFG